MPQPESSPRPRIELDLGAGGLAEETASRRARHVPPPPMPALPRIEPAIPESGVGSDEAERTVGFLLLLSTVPALLSVLLGHGGLGLLGLAIPVYFGIGLIRGDDFVRQWVLAACVLGLVFGLINALLAPRSIVFTLGGILENGALVVLVSGKALAKRTYGICLGALVTGILLGVAGAFRV